MIQETLLTLAALSALIGAIGFFRFPDFYTRVHAATMVTVGGACLALIALALHTHTTAGLGAPYTIKILMITAFILITSPTGSHALADAAHKTGITPKKLAKNDLETIK